MLAFWLLNFSTMFYTQQEYAEMHYLYGVCNGNGLKAARLYRRRHQNDINPRFPNHKVFIRVHRAYSENKLPGRPKHHSGRPGISDDTQEEILQEIRTAPSTSVRKVAQRTGLSKSVVHRTLKNEKLHPYRMQKVQSLLPADFPKRLEFCRTMLRMHRERRDIFDQILWTDECNFSRRGTFNMHNNHNWCSENPHQVREHNFQYQFGINIWAGIFNSQVIGPFELPGRLNGQGFRDFLENEIEDALDEQPLDVRRNMFFQLDGASVHYARTVKDYLQDNFPRKWIGRGGPIPWPPRSPDLNPLDFFFWGYLKSLVYETIPENVEVLRERIQGAQNTIRNNRRVFARLKKFFLRRCRLCVRMNGGLFEQFL